MADATTLAQLQKEAQARQYRFGRTKDGKLWILAPATKDKEFERRLIANKPLIMASTNTPKILQNKVKAAGQENWLESVNGYINSIRDRYMAPAVGAMGAGLDALGGTPISETGIKEDTESFGGPVSRALVPDSLTGKAVDASLLLNPESAALRLGIPPLVGGITGALSGEGGLQGAGQGLLASSIGETARIPGELGAARDFLKRGELTDREWDVKPAKQLSDILNLKSFDREFARFGNWVRALRRGQVGREAGNRFAGKMEDLSDVIHQDALARARKVQQDFLDKLKTPMNPNSRANQQYTEQLWKEARDAKAKVRGILEDAAQLTRGMKKMKSLRRMVYNDEGGMKAGPAVMDAMDKLELSKSAIRDKLSTYSPQLRDNYDAINEEYAMFASLRQVADYEGAIKVPSGHVDLDAINQELDLHPRHYQNRLKDDTFDQVRQLFRRNAPDKPNYEANESYFDQPGELSRLRMIMYGPRGHAAASAETVGNIAGGAPLVTRPVGEVAGRGHVKPGAIPRLLLGGGTNAATDAETR